MKQGEAKIVLVMEEGKVATRREIGNLNGGQLAQLILNVESLLDDLKSQFKLNIQRFDYKNDKPI